MKTITIDNNSCIKCSRCVICCPSAIFIQPDPKAEVSVGSLENCIDCGHCVAICPTGSITHSMFPLNKIHKVDRKNLPTPEQMLELTKVRRSHRGFSQKSVPDEILKQILEAAHAAPTSGNSQVVQYTLVTKPESLSKLSKMVIDIFAKNIRKANSPALKPLLKMVSPMVYKYIPRLELLVKEYEEGRDRILRGAKAVILIHTPKGYGFGVEDTTLAYQNASLMAESLGVAHFFIGFMTTAIKQDKGKSLKELFGIDRDVHAVMALGMPEFIYPNYIERKDIVVEKM